MTRASHAEQAPPKPAEPSNPTLGYLLAESYLWSGQYGRVTQAFESLLRHHSDSAAAHMVMGEAYDGLDRTDQAIKEFQAAADVAPHYPNVHFGLGYLYWKKRQFDKAEGEFQREIEAGSSVAQAKAYLGDIALRRGQPERALTLLREAPRLDPKLRLADLNIGVLHSQPKRYTQAQTALKEAVRLDPSKATCITGSSKCIKRKAGMSWRKSSATRWRNSSRSSTPSCCIRSPVPPRLSLNPRPNRLLLRLFQTRQERTGNTR